MPRIRSLKPEFWDSPGTATASLRTRLLFMAMWNWADDYGEQGWYVALETNGTKRVTVAVDYVTPEEEGAA